jgi:hypothetical protein
MSWLFIKNNSDIRKEITIQGHITSCKQKVYEPLQRWNYAQYTYKMQLTFKRGLTTVSAAEQ